MAATVKPGINSGIALRLERFRLQAMEAKRAELAMLLGRNIRRRRDELGLKQRELGDKVGEHLAAPLPNPGQYISDWERGERQPNARHLEALVSALKVPDAGWLYTDHDAEPVASVTDRLDRIEDALEGLYKLLQPVNTISRPGVEDAGERDADRGGRA